MKYYSDKTKKLYDTEKELMQAEFELKEAENREKIKKEREKAHQEELAAQRKDRAAEVEAARVAMVEAQKKYKEMLNAFIKDYGSFHYTSSSVDDIPIIFDLFDRIFF